MWVLVTTQKNAQQVHHPLASVQLRFKSPADYVILYHHGRQRQNCWRARHEEKNEGHEHMYDDEKRRSRMSCGNPSHATGWRVRTWGSAPHQYRRQSSDSTRRHNHDTDVNYHESHSLDHHSAPDGSRGTHRTHPCTSFPREMILLTSKHNHVHHVSRGAPTRRNQQQRSKYHLAISEENRNIFEQETDSQCAPGQWYDGLKDLKRTFELQTRKAKQKH